MRQRRYDPHTPMTPEDIRARANIRRQLWTRKFTIPPEMQAEIVSCAIDEAVKHPGPTGVGVSTANVDVSGNLTLTLTDAVVLGPWHVVGSTGSAGATGASPVFSIGSVTTRTPGTGATASITGTALAPILNVGIPSGLAGSNGSNGTNAANPIFTPSLSVLSPGASPTVGITGTYPNLSLNFGLSTGSTGSTGAAGPGFHECYVPATLIVLGNMYTWIMSSTQTITTLKVRTSATGITFLVGKLQKNGVDVTSSGFTLNAANSTFTMTISLSVVSGDIVTLVSTSLAAGTGNISASMI